MAKKDNTWLQHLNKHIRAGVLDDQGDGQGGDDQHGKAKQEGTDKVASNTSERLYKLKKNSA